MKMNLTKTVLISMSLLLVLSCGKSKDLKTAPAAPSPSVPAPTAEPAPGEPAKPPTATPKAPELLEEGQPPLPPETDVANQLSPLAPTEVVKESMLRAYQVDFRNQVAVKTGGQSKDLFYTSAGDDGLMEEFKSYAVKVSKEQQAMNTNLAKAVVGAKLARATSSGEMNLNISFDEFGVIKTYRLKAVPADDSMKLVLAQSGTTGQMAFEGGFLKCLDLDGGCEVAYAKMKFAGGYTRVIFRNSLADMHFQYQENVVNNLGFDLWMNYIMNSIDSAPVADLFDSLQTSSYEVVNGRASLGALLTTLDHEAVGLSIPLVVSANKSEVDAQVSKLNDVSLSFDLSADAASYAQNLSQKISGVRLTHNNGLGQLKLKVSLGAGSSQASIWIVAARAQKATVSLEQIRSFESKAPKF